MKVNKVDSINKSVYQKDMYATPAFKAKGLDPDIIAHLNKNGSKLSRFLNYVGANQGEALNIIVTAVGTAVVCPLFIAFNPFSKEDEKTKQYSAWRQPISAIIAVVTQLTITQWFNDWIARAASTKNADGDSNLCSRADLRAQPHERFLKRIIKYEHPEFNKKQIEEEVKRRQLIADKSEISRYRKMMKDKPIEFKDLICQDYIDQAEKQYFNEFKIVNQSEIEKTFNKKIDDIWSTKLKKHLNKMLDEKAKSLGKTKEALLKETAEKLVERDVMAETVAKAIIRHLRDKKIDISKAIETCNVENVRKTIVELGLEDKLTKELDSAKIAKSIVTKLNCMKEYENSLQMKDFTSVKNIGNSFEEILHNVKIKKLVRSRTSDAKRVFKTMNTQMGLVVTLATLPFTCGFLNWSYPRIMEKIMPEMSAKKKEVTEKLENIQEKIDNMIDKINLDDLKDKINVDDLRKRLKIEVEKGGDN